MRLKALCFVVLLSLTWLTIPVQAQQKELVQFSGMIRNATADNVVPYVTIRNLSFNKNLYSSNHQGYFSFVAHPGDTIYFTSLGYKPVTLVIPMQVEDNKYTATVKMETEFVELEAVYPFPWASIDEFNIAFISLEIADDNVVVAQKNLSPESLAALAAIMPMDGNEMRTFNTNQNHIGLSNKAVNQRMANPLLSPFAWGNFIRQISEGSKSRSRNRW